MATVAPKEPGWTEMFVPLQALEVGNIRMDEPRKSTGPGVPLYAIDRPIAALSYHTTNYTLPTLALMTPFVKVYSWDPTTGRLELEVEQDSVIANKCAALQDILLEMLASHPQWFGVNKVQREELRANFQQILTGNILTIYLHGPNPEKKQTGRVWIWRGVGWQKGASFNSFKKGQLIRVALRFQGICFLPVAAGKYRYRLQHQTIAIFQKQL